MSRLTDLIAQAKAKDSQSGANLDREFSVLSSRLPFGLNFERRHPDTTGLLRHFIPKGDKVRLPLALGLTEKGDLTLGQARQHRLTQNLVPITGAGIACGLEAPDHLLPVDSSLFSG